MNRSSTITKSSNTKIRFDIKGRWSEEVNYNSLFKDTRSEKLKYSTFLDEKTQ